MSELPEIGPWWWLAGRAVIWSFARLGMRLRRTGQQYVQPAGPALIVCNHISQADPPLVGIAALPRQLFYMAKSELFEVRGLGHAIGNLGGFPVKRGGADRQAFRTARGILRRGDALLTFPEGTRHRDGRLQPPWPGAGALALEDGVRVIPAAIWGSQGPMGSPVRVAFGPPLDLTGVEGASRSERSSRAADEMMVAIAALLPTVGGPAQEPPRSA